MITEFGCMRLHAHVSLVSWMRHVWCALTLGVIHSAGVDSGRSAWYPVPSNTTLLSTRSLPLLALLLYSKSFRLCVYTWTRWNQTDDGSMQRQIATSNNRSQLRHARTDCNPGPNYSQCRDFGIDLSGSRECSMWASSLYLRNYRSHLIECLMRILHYELYCLV